MPTYDYKCPIGEIMNPNEKILDDMCFLDENGKEISGKNSHWVKWINVKERLPNKFQEVLAFRPDPCEIIITYLVWMLDDAPIWQDEVSNYTHWMLLPNLPEE